MFLHFEDWSAFAFMLKSKGLPNQNQVIKVYASEADPRVKLGKPNLTVIESSGRPFTDEVFEFQGRG